MNENVLEKIAEIGSISINGIKIVLTDEQIKTILKEIQPKNKMGKPKDTENFYRILQNNGKFFVKECQFSMQLAEELYRNKWCFLDKDLAEQTAMDINLKGLLRSFTYENGYDNELDKAGNTKYYIHLTKNDIKIYAETSDATFDTIYFKDKETCMKAIEHVIIPFLMNNPNYRFSIKK